MSDNRPPLPPGFQPELPPGFQMETAQPAAAAPMQSPEPLGVTDLVTGRKVGARPAEVVQAEYDAMPWYKKAGTAADDIVRLGANGLTFGFADKLVGGLGGDTDTQRALTEEARIRSGGAGTVAEVGSGMALPMGAARNGITLVGRFGTQAMRGLPGVLARAGLAGAEGAGYGALGAAGNDRPIDEGTLMGAIMGAGGSTVLDAGRGLVGAALRGTRAPVMTPDQARTAAQQAYTAAENAGVAYTPNSVNRVRNDIVTRLADFGYDPALQPGAAAVLNRLEAMMPGAGGPGTPGANITLKGWDTLRKVASNGYIKGNAANNNIVGMMIDAIDNAVQNPQAGEVLMGNQQAGSQALNTARELWSRVAKADRVGRAMENADFQSDVNVTGNLDRQIRSKMNALRQNGSRGFTPDENAALETTIRGSTMQNVLGQIGRLSPQRNMLMGGALGGGGVATAVHSPAAGVAMMAAPAAGIVADKAANRLSQGNVQELINIIMNGGRALPPTAAQRAVQGSYNPLLQAIFGSNASQPYVAPVEQK